VIRIFGVTIGGSRLESYYGKPDDGGATKKAILASLGPNVYRCEPDVSIELR
jgi:hypothetical protein